MEAKVLNIVLTSTWYLGRYLDTATSCLGGWDAVDSLGTPAKIRGNFAFYGY